MAGQTLDGIRVLELAQGVAGPYCGKLFADFGAEVVKLEPPGGDPQRQAVVVPGDRPDLEQGAAFLHLNTNKRSIVADPEAPEGVNLIRRLVASSDLVIESYAPGTLDGWGLGFEALREVQPSLVLASVTAFGQTGPYADYVGEEIVHYAMGGPMYATGLVEREPVKLGGNIIQMQCGNMAATAALAALMTARGDGGEAIHVDISNFETQAGSIDRRLAFLLGYSYNGVNAPREATQRISPAPMGVYPVLDGYVQIITIPAWVPRMLATIDDPDLRKAYENPAWIFDPTTHEVTDGVLYPWLLERTKQEAMEAAQAHSWPLTALNSPADVIADGHFRERGFMVEVDHPAAGRIRQPGAPFRMAGGWALRRPAPLLDEHRDEVLAELARAASVRTATGARKKKEGTRLPLEGVRVLDLTVVWAGPYTTMLLADLGAEVIRVDNPWLFPSSTKGFAPRVSKEMAEMLGPLMAAFPDRDPGERPWNRHAMFNCHARGKKIVTLDLRSELGRETFLRLVDCSDVLVENNAARTVEKLGIDWDTLHARNPRFTLLRMPPMGVSGRYRDYVGFGAHFEALSGLTAIRGYADADPTSTTSVFHMDPASGATGAFAVMLAMLRREQTGEGSFIEFAQAENMINHIGEYFLDAARTDRHHEPIGNRHATRAPQGCYPCEGEPAWVVVSVGSDTEWAGLRAAMGDPAWASDERFDSAEGRRAHHDEIDEGIVTWTKGVGALDVFQRCQQAGVPAGPVLRESDVFVDPHLRARGFFRTNSSDDCGTHDYPAHLWHWTGPEMAWGEVPCMGAANEEVYKGIVGMSDEEYAALEADGHIATGYLNPDGTSV